MPPPAPDNRDRASAYADGNPDAVRAARPPEPSEAEWDAIRARIQARVAAQQPRSFVRRATLVGAGVGLGFAAVAAVVAWLVFGLPPAPPPQTPEVVRQKPAPPAEVDPLAEFDVLPMATEDEVVLHRVPGDGWLPVGAHPLTGDLALATADEVALDDPNPEWPAMVPAPKSAPMIFAAKPR
jgi:hypothetical protein